MSRVNIIYDVFVSSPGDVVEEREIIGKIVNEINSTHSRVYGKSLNILDFESYTYPNRGEYAQGVINEQIGEYDIFIAILGDRFGTPTKVAGSGTEEEIREAMRRYDCGEIDNLLIYLSTIPPNMDELDMDQFEKVELFKEELFKGDSRQLCDKYGSFEEFEGKIRSDLTNVFVKLEGYGSD